MLIFVRIGCKLSKAQLERILKGTSNANLGKALQEIRGLEKLPINDIFPDCLYCFSNL